MAQLSPLESSPSSICARVVVAAAAPVAAAAVAAAAAAATTLLLLLLPPLSKLVVRSGGWPKGVFKREMLGQSRDCLGCFGQVLVKEATHGG